jgi:hypothetical protein
MDTLGPGNLRVPFWMGCDRNCLGVPVRCPSFGHAKQARENDICELCGQSEGWERAAIDPPNPDRCRLIAVSTIYSDEELNSYIANSSIDVAFVNHCARILRLRGVPRVRSFWERAGFDLNGKSIG